MALMQCPDCHKEVSDQAPACPHCGRPLAGTFEKKPAKHYGCGTLIVGLVTLFAVATCWNATRDEPAAPVTRASHASDRPENAEIVRASKTELRQLTAIRNVEWVDGDMTIAVEDNGGSWDSVADSTCTWLRSRGFKGDVAVSVLDATALRNKRWKQLARQRCN